MGWFINSEDVPVELDCRCPGQPHDKDTVWLYGETPVELGLAFELAVADGAPSVNSMMAVLGTTLLEHGIRRWTFVDEQGQPVPCTLWTRAQFAKNSEAARNVAEKADALYSDSLMRPLLQRQSRKPSGTGRTARLTSRPRTTSKPRPKRSRPSTTATTPRLLPVTTSSVGGSNSSPRKKSA